MPDLFRWNPDAFRYIAESGRFVPRPAVRAALDVVLDKQMERVRAMSDNLASGNVTLPEWRQGMLESLKTAHLEGLATARGGWSQLTDEHYQWVGQRVRGQLDYLENFTQQIASGEQSLEGIGSRAELYIEAGRGTHRESERLMGAEQGHTEERNFLGGSRETCDECSGLWALGWQSIGSLPDVGARQCLSRCHCSIATRNAIQPGSEG